MIFVYRALLTLTLLAGDLAFAGYPASRCRGLLVGPRVRAYNKASRSPYVITMYELNRERTAKFVALEVTHQHDSGEFSFRFVESSTETTRHEGPVWNEEPVQKRFANDFYRRAWLAAAAIRDFGDQITQLDFAWDSDYLSWRDFEDTWQIENGQPQVAGAWLSKFLQRRGFSRARLHDLNLPPGYFDPADSRPPRLRFETLRGLDYHARQTYARLPLTLTGH